MARQVQLAPGSLALVLSPREAGQATEKRGGRALFRAFRRANARCFWNERLAHAASRLAFLGWLQRRVLLVRAPQPCVQVLRDAWRRRALRSPRGFRITAVGSCASKERKVGLLTREKDSRVGDHIPGILSTALQLSCMTLA
ncbi:hypothetical protein ACRRTK_022052 [Alexandromys fortis]